VHSVPGQPPTVPGISRACLTGTSPGAGIGPQGARLAFPVDVPAYGISDMCTYLIR